jgi:hypothetical protein
MANLRSVAITASTMTVHQNGKQRQRNSKTITKSGRFTPFKRLCFWLVIGNVFLCILYLRRASWRIQSQTEGWADFSQYYQKTFRRQPPKGLESWLKFAQQQKCGTRGHHYEALDQDLKFFRGQIQLSGRPLDLEQVIPMGKKITNFYIAFSLDNHKLTVEEYHGKGWGFEWDSSQWQYTKTLLMANLEPIRKHKPPIRTRFVINLHDRAQNASVHATYPVFSYCKDDYYTNDKPIPHVMFNHSNSVDIDSAIHEGPYPQEIVTSRDLLIPARSSLQPERLDMWFWPFYSRGPRFHSRRDIIVWRGATTGVWGTGPRFHLMGKFGGTDIHPLGNDSGVLADFAFTRNIQQPAKAESTKIRHRFTLHMFYWQMQRIKYILDVDGNGKHLMG